LGACPAVVAELAGHRPVWRPAPARRPPPPSGPRPPGGAAPAVRPL